MNNCRIFLRLTVVLFFVLSFGSTASAAGVIDLPRTGQTTSHAIGDDGDWQAGVTWPSPRFVSGTGIEANCMIDKLTGLMWPKNGNLAGGTKTWQDALTYSNNLNYCGHTDWRLPNVNELESLVNLEEPDTSAWLNIQGFYSVQSNSYWSSSTHRQHSNNALYVVMLYGDVAFHDKTSSGYANVFPVRSSSAAGVIDLPRTGQTISYATGDDGDWQAGIAWPSPRFVSGTGAEADCMIDTLTGLMWLKNGDLAGVAKTWQDALTYSNNLNYCGHSDWRLPNRKELMSLVNRGESSTATWLWTQGLIYVHGGTYWSSSPEDRWHYAWSVDMHHLNYVLSISKIDYHYVFPVRGGQSAILPPVAPEALKATANSSGKITLAWLDKSVYETGYKVFRKVGAGKFVLLNSLPADTETYVDSTATGNDTTTAYSYYVKACSAAGCSKSTPQAVVPYKPTNLVATKVTNGVNLSWTDNSANEKGFKIYRTEGTCSSMNPLKLIKITAADATTFTGGLAPGTYSYKVRAFTQSVLQPYSYGYSTFSNCVTVTVP